MKLDSSTNIAAYGTIVCVNGPDNLLHGAPLPKNCMRVAIDEAVDKSGLLPFPIPSECDVIGDAVGTHVAWPQHLLVKKDEVCVILYFKFECINNFLLFNLSNL